MATMTMLEPVRERFSELVATMSARDRALFTGLVVFAVLALFGGTWWLGRSMLGDLQSRIDDRESALALVTGLAADNAEASAQVASIEEELRKNSGQDLPSFIEKAADKAGISGNLQSVREKQVTTDGSLEEKSYTVEVSKVSLEQLTSFLYAVETGGYPLRIRSMKVTTATVGGVKVLNVKPLEISAFRLIEDGAPSATAPTEEGEATP